MQKNPVTNHSGQDDGVQMNHSRAVVGIVLGLAIAAGFEFELAWLFLGALVMFFGWLGYLMFGSDS